MHPLIEALKQSAVPFVDLRRELHRKPELGLREVATAARIATLLREWGYEVHEGIAGTGVVGQLRRGEQGPSLGLRADMDALPIHEQGNKAWSSENPGVMHACGHDGHMAMLLAAAHYIARNVRFSGTLNLIFQPAEEHPGGARLMLEDGLFDQFPCDAIFAMHNMPGVALGNFIFRDGPMMASSDDVTIVLEGQGGHGAMPHRCTDSIVAAAAIILALQTIVSRNVDPRLAAVVSVGAVQAGEANNVIPSHARLEVSVRALDANTRDLLERRIRELVQAQAASFGVHARIDYRRDYPVLVNAKDATELAREVGRELVGCDRVVAQGEPLTGSEDFAFLLEQRPGCYLLIGNGDGDGICGLHDDQYDFHDDNVAQGAAYWVLLVKRFLGAL